MFLWLFVLFNTSLTHATLYTVQKGDTFSKIAHKTPISLLDIRRLNDVYTDQLTIGDVLFLPSEILNYVVKKGDTIHSLSSKFGINMKYIVTFNNIAESSLEEGSNLRIPIKNDLHSFSKPVLSSKIFQEKSSFSNFREPVNSSASLTKISHSKMSSIPIFSPNSQKKVNEPSLNSLLNKECVTIYHIVKFGEDLFSIAKHYNVSIESLKSWNKKPTSALFVGEKLIIYRPHVQLNPQKNLNIFSYTVKKGDTLYHIAMEFSVSIDDIKKWNNKQKDSLFIGEILTIHTRKSYNNLPTQQEEILLSQTSKIEQEKIFYRVKPGDNLHTIAKQFNINVLQLKSWNNKVHNHLYIDEDLTIFVPKKRVNTTNTLTLSPLAKLIKNESRNNVCKKIKSDKFHDIGLPISKDLIRQILPSGRGAEFVVNGARIIYAPANVKVYYAGYLNALRNVLILTLSDNRTIVYAGLGDLYVKSGQSLKKGEAIAITGTKLDGKKSSFYIEMRDKRNIIDPCYVYGKR